MFEVDKLIRDNEELKWQYYYQTNDIDMIYRAIEISESENKIVNKEILSYRILIDNRVFAFIPANNEYQLNFMREHYKSNDKCKPRYTCDEYTTYMEKVKKKGGR